PITHLAVDTEKRHLLSSSNDGTVRIWHLDTLYCLETLEEKHRDDVRCSAYIVRLLMQSTTTSLETSFSHFSCDVTLIHPKEENRIMTGGKDRWLVQWDKPVVRKRKGKEPKYSPVATLLTPFPVKCLLVRGLSPF